MSLIFNFKERIKQIFYLNNKSEQSGDSKYFHWPSCKMTSHGLIFAGNVIIIIITVPVREAGGDVGVLSSWFQHLPTHQSQL